MWILNVEVVSLLWIGSVYANLNCLSYAEVSKDQSLLTRFDLQNISLYFIVDYGIISKQDSEDIVFKGNTINPQSKVPISMMYHRHRNELVISVQKKNVHRSNSFLGYLNRRLGDDTYCKIFTTDKKHCSRKYKPTSVISQQFLIISSNIKNIYLLKTCNVIPMAHDNYLVQKELLILSSEKLYSYNKNLNYVLDENIKMKNLSFTKINKSGFDVCEDIQNSLNGCVSKIVSLILILCFMALIGIFIVSFVAIKVIIYMLNRNKVSPFKLPYSVNNVSEPRY